MNGVLISGSLALSLTAHDVRLHGERIPMANREFEVLTLLMQNPNRVLTRVYLYETIWAEDAMGDLRTVDVHMAKLRQKIGDSWVTTVRGVGYRFEPAELDIECKHAFVCAHCGTVYGEAQR